MPFEAYERDDLDIETWVKQMKAEYGYAQISIFDPDTKRPGFAFTIGLEASRNVPELLCLGVAPDIASQLFSLCVEAHDSGSVNLAAGSQDLTGLVPDHRIRLQRTTPAMVQRTNAAKPQSHREIGAVVHVLLPDNAGFFPGEAACDAQVAAAQDVDWLLAPIPN